ncbi:hypothetical protein Vadar_027269 [Vaccinium darrowii]|uniref:Uncharacterized protein n=1 Tax=Vaccinium darrowii TaxID=229202 RepID=A0ACB7Z777_9ERIC|nr:hypothetical protein Vadar_027269 [Vaccinium darrowii]
MKEFWTPVSLFVDFLPEDVGVSWFRSLFSKYGLVNDSFIPAKRSKSSGCRFGFVRFAKRQDAEIAISNLHGVWIENRRLLVKTARFDKKGNEQNLNVHSVRTRNPISTQDYTQRAPVTNGVTNNASRSYAQVVKEKEENEPNQMGVENRDTSTVQRGKEIVIQGMNYMVRVEEMETFRVVNPITTPSYGAEFNGRDGDMANNKNDKDDRLAKNHALDVRTTQLANKGDNLVNVEDPNKQGGATQAEAAENNKEDTSNFSQELDSFVEDSKGPKGPIMIIGQDQENLGTNGRIEKGEESLTVETNGIMEVVEDTLEMEGQLAKGMNSNSIFNDNFSYAEALSKPAAHTNAMVENLVEVVEKNVDVAMSAKLVPNNDIVDELEVEIVNETPVENRSEIKVDEVDAVEESPNEVDAVEIDEDQLSSWNKICIVGETKIWWKGVLNH